MTIEPTRPDALDPEWVERFTADVREDSRCERLILIKAVAIAVVVGALAIARLILI